jgi:hypothetical protein
LQNAQPSTRILNGLIFFGRSSVVHGELAQPHSARKQPPNRIRGKLIELISQITALLDAKQEQLIEKDSQGLSQN